MVRLSTFLIVRLLHLILLVELLIVDGVNDLLLGSVPFRILASLLSDNGRSGDGFVAEYYFGFEAEVVFGVLMIRTLFSKLRTWLSIWTMTSVRLLGHSPLEPTPGWW